MLSRVVGAILSVLIIVYANTACADEYGSALKRAKSEDKPVVIYFYSKYCPYCTAMDKDVLFDKDIKKSLSSDVVYLRVNVDLQKELARRYNIRGYPTTWLLEPEGKRIAALPGYISKKNFKTVLAFLKGKHYRVKDLWDYIEGS